MVSIHQEHCIGDNGNVETVEYCQMYFGSLNGIYRQFPGVESTVNTDGNIPNFDPRLRPWYIAAASGEHIIVILMDVSDSMRQNRRIAQLQTAVKSLLHILPSSTWISIVAFNDDVILPCFGVSMTLCLCRFVIANLFMFINKNTI